MCFSETVSAMMLHSPSKTMLTCLHTPIHPAAEVGPITECHYMVLQEMFSMSRRIDRACVRRSIRTAYATDQSTHLATPPH